MSASKNAVISRRKPLINKKALMRNLKGYAFIAPNYVLMLVFLAFPVIFALVLAFSEWDLVSGLSNIKFVGIKNFLAMPGDKWFVNSIINNFYFTLTVVPGTLILSIFIAVLINEFAYGKVFQAGHFHALYIKHCRCLINLVAFIQQVRPDNKHAEKPGHGQTSRFPGR